MPTVPIPGYFNVRSMYRVIGAAIDEQQQPRHAAMSFDFSHVAFAEPDGVTVLSNLVEWLRKRGVQCTFVGCDLVRPATKYMDDCGFFKNLPARRSVTFRGSEAPRSASEKSRASNHTRGWIRQYHGSPVA
jgi:hypothetical protein